MQGCYKILAFHNFFPNLSEVKFQNLLLGIVQKDCTVQLAITGIFDLQLYYWYMATLTLLKKAHLLLYKFRSNSNANS